MLDGLVGWTVLTHAHRIMAPHEDVPGARQGGQAHGTAHVVTEYKKSAVHGQHPAMEGQTVANSTHSVLSNTEEDLTSLGAFGPLYAFVGDGRARVTRQVGPATDQAGHHVKQGLQAGVPGFPGSYGCTHLPGGETFLPPSDPFACQCSIPRGTVGVGGGQTLLPSGSGLGTTTASYAVEVQDVLGDVERLVG